METKRNDLEGLSSGDPATPERTGKTEMDPSLRAHCILTYR
jgi:hypothetical protein